MFVVTQGKTGSAGALGSRDLRLVGVYEERHPDAGLCQLHTARAQGLPSADDVQTTLGRQLGTAFRHQATIMGANGAGELDHFGRDRHLEIHASPEQLAQQAHVALLDVATVLAQVQRDVVGTGLFGHERGLHRLGILGMTLLPQCCHVVDIDTQVDCGGHQTLCSLRG